MVRQNGKVVATAAAVVVLVACGSSAPAHRPTPTPTPKPPGRPSPTAVPSGPYAVIVTNKQRQGDTYSVQLLDMAGQTVASVTAKLPLLKPNQTVSPPLVSATDDRVFYLDGDTDIRSLVPSGQSALAKTISAGATAALGFSVSPDDTRIAVSLISEASDAAKDTGTGYVEDLAGSGNHAVLWNNTKTDALRWPVGWDGAHLIDDIGGCGGGGPGYGYTPPAACSYHVVDAASATRIATVCESPAKQPYDGSINYDLTGAVTTSGVACLEYAYHYGDCTGSTDSFTITAVDWTGHEHDFLTKSASSCSNLQQPLNSCFLSTDGRLMACRDATSQAVTLLNPDGSTRSLGRKYDVLGWIDAGHLLVDVDPNTLGVVTAGTGSLLSIPTQHADQIDMVGTLPGAL
jgi:hypothetical protein